MAGNTAGGLPGGIYHLHDRLLDDRLQPVAGSLMYGAGLPYDTGRLLRLHQRRTQSLSSGRAGQAAGKGTAFLSLTTKSEIIKDEFCNYLYSITGKEYKPKRNKRDDIYNIGCGGHSACKVLKQIYQDSTIHLNRKYKKYLDCLNWENQNNKPKRNISGTIGVGIDRRNNKWLSYLTINGKYINLGSYCNKEEAIKARLKKEKEYFGKFAPQKYLFKQYNLEE